MSHRKLRVGMVGGGGPSNFFGAPHRRAILMDNAAELTAGALRSKPDESIESARDAATAIALDACRVINIKPARVGGYLEARRIHDIAVANGIPVWCGGMLETGVGRAPNVALAALPGFVLPGDTSASDRYFRPDITAPFVLDQGHVAVPTGPGIGVDVLPDALAEVTISRSDVDLTG